MTEEQNNNPWELLAKGAKEFGLQIAPSQMEQFQSYARLLEEWNRVMNLTTITEPTEVVRRHFLDSLSVMKYSALPENAKLVDVGTGAGFPGLPLKIMLPGLRVTFLDSLNKRLEFLTAVTEQLNITGTRCVHSRAEDAGRSPSLREHFDVATARAVAGLRVLAELCLPLVKPGGCFIAMKGPDAAQETEEAQKAVKLLGAEIEKVEAFALPGTDMSRTIIVIKKTGHTPKTYPRTNAKIKASPL